MRFPITCYWDCIAPYLVIKELSILEASVDNHMTRRSLDLEDIYDHNESITQIYPYERLSCLASAHIISLSSEAMRLWCEKRHVIIQNLHLEYNLPEYIEGENRVRDLLSYVKYLKVNKSFENFDFRQFGSTIESLDYAYDLAGPELDIWDHFDTLFLELPSSNDAIMPTRYCSNLRSLSFKGVVGEVISRDQFNSLISYTPSIQSFVSENEWITSSNIIFMAQYWLQLKSISLHIHHNDSIDLTPFQASGHQFQSVRYLTGNPAVTIGDFTILACHSQPTLQKLEFRNLYHAITEDNLINIIFKQYHHITSFRINNYDLVMTKTAFVIMAECLPQLEMVDFCCQFNIDDSSVEAIATSCRQLHTIQLQACQKYSDMLTKKSYEVLAKAYKKQLKVVSLNYLTTSVTLSDVNMIFADCYHDVRVYPYHTHKHHQMADAGLTNPYY